MVTFVFGVALIFRDFEERFVGDRCLDWAATE